MQPPYVTERDPSLPHQVVFFIPTRKSHVHVSCNCRVITETGNYRGEPYYKPMGQSDDLETARKLYDDPANHNKPFTEADVAKW